MFNEVHSIHGHTLLLITKSSLQATALLQHLKQSLAITGKLHNIQRSLDDISSGSIILLDMMEADKKLRLSAPRLLLPILKVLLVWQSVAARG